ncbi:hypothetical protein CB1_000293001 [Camelus ferus]|nr:hypothetical protein CB1_000293001 [Camelus ferus]
MIRVNSMSIIGSTNLIVYITQVILMYVFQNIMVMILVMDTKILILIMKVNFDILENEKHRMLKKVQFIQLLVTKIIMKMTGNMRSDAYYEFFRDFWGKQKWFMKQNTEESAIGRKLSDHKLNNTPDADWLQLKPLADLKETGIANIAWMVIMGDGIHNFSDGLAIGDFAVLLKAGMTVKQAIVYNLLSAMMAYIGMLIGTAVGQYANNITLWIFAITAGMFLYVALVDMLPEMLHGDGDNEEHGFCPVGQFILQNLGLLFGFAIMLVIALYEDKIVFDLQF